MADEAKRREGPGAAALVAAIPLLTGLTAMPMGCGPGQGGDDDDETSPFVAPQVPTDTPTAEVAPQPGPTDTPEGTATDVVAPQPPPTDTPSTPTLGPQPPPQPPPTPTPSEEQTVGPQPPPQPPPTPTADAPTVKP